MKTVQVAAAIISSLRMEDGAGDNADAPISMRDIWGAGFKPRMLQLQSFLCKPSKHMKILCDDKSWFKTILFLWKTQVMENRIDFSLTHVTLAAKLQKGMD